MSKPISGKKKNADSTKAKSKLGTFEENWLENSLKKSYEKSGDSALGVSKNNRASPVPEVTDHVNTETNDMGFFGTPLGANSSALDMFGISREALSEIGMADRSTQDRLYRTLTIWSSTLYDSLFSISNGKKDIQGRIWKVYTRLIEICNPETSSLVAIELRKEFEEKLRLLSSSLEESKARSKEETERLKRRLAEVERAHAISSSTSEKEVPKLRKELMTAHETVARLEEDVAQRDITITQQNKDSQLLQSQIESGLGEINPLKNEVKVLRDELTSSNSEIQRYIDMYLEADKIVRRNESSVSMAQGEKERLVTKMATMLKKSQEKDMEIARITSVVGERDTEVETLGLELAESQQKVDDSALTLHKFIQKSKATQVDHISQITSLKERYKPCRCVD